MAMTRRAMLLGTLGTYGLLAAGCAMDPSQMANRPGPAWPDDPDRPAIDPRQPAPPVGPAQPQPPAPQPPVSNHSVASLKVIPRTAWAKAAPIPSRLNAIGSVKLITVHHEGWTPVWFDDTRSVADRLDSIRRSHIERLHAADIGYHFVIDRAGRIWEGRKLAYQGAHVREHNENNLGIMVLGNFDQQQPSTAQISSLRLTLSTLTKMYRVDVRTVYTHQELNRTECPGKALQAHMTQLRRNGLG